MRRNLAQLMISMRLSDHRQLVPDWLDIPYSQHTLSFHLLTSPKSWHSSTHSPVMSFLGQFFQGEPVQFFKTPQTRAPAEAHSPKFLETIILPKYYGTLLWKLILFSYVTSPSSFMSVTTSVSKTDPRLDYYCSSTCPTILSKADVPINSPTNA